MRTFYTPLPALLLLAACTGGVDPTDTADTAAADTAAADTAAADSALSDTAAERAERFPLRHKRRHADVQVEQLQLMCQAGLYCDSLRSDTAAAELDDCIQRQEGQWENFYNTHPNICADEPLRARCLEILLPLTPSTPEDCVDYDFWEDWVGSARDTGCYKDWEMSCDER